MTKKTKIIDIARIMPKMYRSYILNNSNKLKVNVKAKALKLYKLVVFPVGESLLNSNTYLYKSQ